MIHVPLTCRRRARAAKNATNEPKYLSVGASAPRLQIRVVGFDAGRDRAWRRLHREPQGGPAGMSAEANLRLKLESGASRVFNLLQITRAMREALKREPTPEELFFASRGLNDVILIKEPNVAGEKGGDPFDAPLPVRTKIYVPYNAENPYEGGQSSFTDDARFEEVLAYMVGKDRVDAGSFERDLRKIRTLEQMPSLDPFLLRDRFAMSGEAVNEAYFRLSEEDWRAIRAHMRERFVLIGRFATEGRGDVPAATIDMLVDRIWEARNLEPLFPLLAAFGLPADRAGEFFYSWKGIGFFDYEFTRNTSKVRAFSQWIQAAQPRGYADREEAEAIERGRAHVRARVRAMLGDTLQTLGEFNTSFDQLFRKRETAANFSNFMLHSRRHFWRLGNNLNGIYHVLTIWDRATRRSVDRTLPVQQMIELLRIMRELL
jgi:hypothetical protein